MAMSKVFILPGVPPNSLSIRPFIVCIQTFAICVQHLPVLKSTLLHPHPAPRPNPSASVPATHLSGSLEGLNLTQHGISVPHGCLSKLLLDAVASVQAHCSNAMVWARRFRHGQWSGMSDRVARARCSLMRLPASRLNTGMES
eukprot:1161685-Pelagomonas_calceolata.AAC.11